MKSYRKIYQFLSLICLFVFILSAFVFANDNISHVKVNIGQVKKESFGNIIKRISRNSGVNISYDESLSNIPITGIFSSISIERFLRRVLKDENYSVLALPDTGEIIIQTIGKKNKLTSAKDYITSEVMRDLSVLSPQSSSKIREKQNRILEDKLREQNTISPLVDIGVAALQKLHLRQDTVMHSMMLDPDGYEPVTKVKFVTIENCHKKQELSLNNRDTALQRAILGKEKLDIVKDNLQRQDYTLSVNLGNVNYVDPISGMTLSKLDLFHKQQELALKRN